MKDMFDWCVVTLSMAGILSLAILIVYQLCMTMWLEAFGAWIALMFWAYLWSGIIDSVAKRHPTKKTGA